MSAVAATDSSVKPMNRLRRTPERSATAPRTGDSTATMAMERETTRPHQ
jgi:hypothetical protein